MNLIENMYETFTFLDVQRIPDGEGGFIPTYVESVSFQAHAGLNTTIEARVAEAQGVRSVYTITTPKNVVLKYDDKIKRISDGKLFRITSDAGDKVAPAVSTLNIAQVTAEKWEMTS